MNLANLDGRGTDQQASQKEELIERIEIIIIQILSGFIAKRRFFSQLTLKKLTGIDCRVNGRRFDSIRLA